MKNKFYLYTLSFFTFCICATEGRAQIKLIDVPAVKPPAINNDKITYYVDFVFSNNPQNYWVFYDLKLKRFIIEFYSGHIEAPPLSFKETALFRDLKVNNFESGMSLSGKRSQISFALPLGWYYETDERENILCVKFWKMLRPSEVIKENKFKKVFPYIATFIGAGLITFITILIVNNSK